MVCSTPVQIVLSGPDGLAGGVFLYKLPLETPLDYHCVPKGLLSFADCEKLSREIAGKQSGGIIQGLTWVVK